MKLPAKRACYFYGFLICLLLVAAAVYLQLEESLAPCPLCQLQRIVFTVLGLVFLFAALKNPSPRATKIYGLIIFWLAIIGGGVAIRQLWLQNTPHVLGENCGVGLNYLLHTLPLTDAIKTILQGTGDCAEVHWQFLGLTLPGWSLVGFIAAGILGVWQNFRDGIK